MHIKEIKRLFLIETLIFDKFKQKQEKQGTLAELSSFGSSSLAIIWKTMFLLDH